VIGRLGTPDPGQIGDGNRDLTWTLQGNRGALRTYREPGFGTGFPGEKGMVLEIGSYRGNRANPAVFPLPGERETVS